MPISTKDINKVAANKDYNANKANANATVANRDIIKDALCNTYGNTTEAPVDEKSKIEHAKNAYTVKKFPNTYKKEFINSRFNRARDVLRNPGDLDKHFFKRIGQSIRAHSMGCLWGMLDGALSGWLIGLKFGGHGGWIIGGISQLAAMFLAMGVGIINGAVNGIVTNKEEASLLVRDHRYAIGSTMGDEILKTSIDMFPSYEAPSYITKGDKKNINYY